jgi:aldehyde dehydrogenase (NAD+)
VLEPVGVCALITPWNWPVNQIACKVVPALAAGCTMVLKPSELAPLSAVAWTRVIEEAGVPAGVFNLVQGDGPVVGAALAAHPDVDMVSFTGSTRAGAEVARNAAPSIKRVHQELGGKSPNLLLDDSDLGRAVKAGVLAVMQNSGQSCNAPTRMLVPEPWLDEVEEVAREVVNAVRVGDPADARTQMGPLVSQAQWQRVQSLIEKGIAEGARLVAGGPGRPEGIGRGWFARPTLFSQVSPDMTIAREEIFGPVLSILPYRDEEEAVRIANDTPYGLSAYLWSADPVRASRVARRLRAGMVHINGAPLDNRAPFGGYKMSGNGREWGAHGLREFLETKAIMGEIET